MFFENAEKPLQLFRIVGISNCIFHEFISATPTSQSTDKMMFQASKILDLACFGVFSYFLLVGKLPERVVEGNELITYKIDLNDEKIKPGASSFLSNIFSYVEIGEVEWEQIISKVDLINFNLPNSRFTENNFPMDSMNKEETNCYFDQFVNDFKNAEVPVVYDVVRRRVVGSDFRRALLNDIQKR